MSDLAEIDNDIFRAVDRSPEPAGPRPTPTPTETENATPNLNPKTGKEWVDKQGYTFDKRIHETSNGKPRIHYGWLKRKKGWQKAIQEVHADQREENPKETNDSGESSEVVSETSKEKESKPEPQNENPPKLEENPKETNSSGDSQGVPEQNGGFVDPDAPPPGDLNEKVATMTDRKLAEMICGTYVIQGQRKFGKEWEPEQIGDTGKTDFDHMVDEWESFLAAKNAGENLPDWAPPALCMVTYGTNRFLKKDSRTKKGVMSWMERANHKMRMWFHWAKFRFTGRPAPTPPSHEEKEEAEDAS